MSTLADAIRPVGEAVVNAVADRAGNLVSTLWDYSLGLVVSIIFLSRKADEVAGETKKLEALREDVKQQAEDEVRRSTPAADVSNQLSGWMSRVSSLAADATNFQRSFEDGSSCVTRLRLGYDAVDLLRQAKSLTDEGKAFFDGALPLSRPRGPDPVEKVPSETSSSTIVGGTDSLQRVQSCILDDGVGIIGIYGMGGVGKTTTLKIINNEFLLEEACRDRFEVSIWVTVSRDVQVSAIRSVADRLKLPSDAGKDRIFHELSKKRFILLLDDVWECLDLEEIGIPSPKTSNRKSKILFTTRTIKVCSAMDADEKVAINVLDGRSSWVLFRSKFGRDGARVLDDDLSIRQLAEQVVRRCGGLPIALVTVGRAMSNARTRYDWNDAIEKLDYAAGLLPGMEEKVLKLLEFSFDKLRNDALQKCLLYCALFPEDHVIPKQRIIDYWIGEGLLDREGFVEDIDIEDTRRRGNALITELQNAGLLEEGPLDYPIYIYEGDGKTVMLHDTVRDMALWIAGHDFVVLSGHADSRPIPERSIWESAQRISLMNNPQIFEERNSIPPSSPPPRRSLSCPNLKTLLLQDNNSEAIILKGYFNFSSMANLRVLDLAFVELSEFPTEITSLTSLRYLDLSRSMFDSLPVQLGNLTNLRHLILRNTRRLEWIAVEAISRLSRLQVLNMMDSRYRFGREDSSLKKRLCPTQLELSDLADHLKSLSELYLPWLQSWASLGVIAASPVLRRSTRSIDLVIEEGTSCVDSPSPLSEQIGSLSALRQLALSGGPPPDPAVMVELQLYPVSRLRNLEVLHLYGLREGNIPTINLSSPHHSEPYLFPRLRQLFIVNCDGFSELTWVGRLPCLEELNVWKCKDLKELVPPDVDGGDANDHQSLTTTMPSFPKLKDMDLQNLPSLRSISARPFLLFPCLKRLAVVGCPLLQRLPLGHQSARNLRSIEGEKEWWDGLEWDNNADRQLFSSKFEEW